MAVEDDGLAFNAESVRGDTIKEDQEYEGLRLTLDCRLENARIPIQIDIGFGDVVTPAASEVTYPVLLDFPAPDPGCVLAGIRGGRKVSGNGHAGHRQ